MKALSTWWRRAAAARAVEDVRGLTFLPGRPGPRWKNEGGRIAMGSVTIGPGVRVWAGAEGEIDVGDGTILEEGVELVSWRSLRIGARCRLGVDVLVMDTDLHGPGGTEADRRPVRIGDGARLGSRTIVLKGVTIGEGAVVEPGSIVVRDIPAGTVFGPPPARVIERGGDKK